MQAMGMLLNCGGDILLNMGAIGALVIEDGEDPLVSVTWVMGGETAVFDGKAASHIIAELRRQLPPPVDPDSAEAKLARLRR